MRLASDADRLIEALQARLDGDRQLAKRIAERTLELERQRADAQRAYREANRLLHRLDLNSGPYASMRMQRKLAVLEALLRAENR